MGSTGASIAAATVVYGTLEGIDRGALGGPVVGYAPNTVIIDLGTNVDTKPSLLVDFAALGNAMSKLIYKNENPRIAEDEVEDAIILLPFSSSIEPLFHSLKPC